MRSRFVLPLAGLAAVMYGIAAVAAFDIVTDVSRYSDAETMTRAEKTGIGVLTDIGAVEGYPDGSFRADRYLNRAEFLKIVLASHPDTVNAVDNLIPWNCFPDVQSGFWFTPYVCYAKQQEIVGGYPDGTFKPEQSVNYAEAVKMLSELYGYALDRQDNDAWYQPYLRAAFLKGTLLPGNIDAGAFITRGQMARLAAAFRAEKEGALEAYRAMERGAVIASSSSSRSSSSSSAVSSAASSSSATASTSSSSYTAATSHFLLFDSITPPLFDGTFTNVGPEAEVKIVEVELRREIKSFSGLILEDSLGRQIARLKLATADNTTKKFWRAEMLSGYFISANSDRIFVIKAEMKRRNDGTPSELVEIADFSVTVQEPASGVSREIVPTNTHVPFHITAQGRIASVHSTMDAAGTLQVGQKRQLAGVTVTGQALEDVAVSLESLSLHVTSDGVKLSNVTIGDGSPINSASCSIDSSVPGQYFCDTLPEALRRTPSTLKLFADVSLLAGRTSGTVQLSLTTPGSTSSLGDIFWTDGTGRYRWVDLEAPLMNGTVWTVMP